MRSGRRDLRQADHDLVDAIQHPERQSALILPPGAFRLFLASLVLVSHLSLLNVGRIAVALFFMLSGYWISYLWERMSGYAHVGKFFLNRLLRIFPLYLIVVILCILMFPVRITAPTFLLLGVASTDGPRAIGVEWSLDVEFQFYLIFPFLIALQRLGPLGYVLVGCLTAIGWYLYSHDDIVLVLPYLPVFVCGMLIFKSRYRPSLSVAFISTGLAFAVFAIAAIIPETRGLAISSLAPLPLFTQDIFAVALSLVIAPYVAASLNTKSSALDRALGDSSYPLYLVHEPTIRLFKALALPTQMSQHLSALARVELIPIIGAVTAIIYLFIDRPAERLRRQWLG